MSKKKEAPVAEEKVVVKEVHHHHYHGTPYPYYRTYPAYPYPQIWCGGTSPGTSSGVVWNGAVS